MVADSLRRQETAYAHADILSALAQRKAQLESEPFPRLTASRKQLADAATTADSLRYNVCLTLTQAHETLRQLRDLQHTLAQYTGYTEPIRIRLGSGRLWNPDREYPETDTYPRYLILSTECDGSATAYEPYPDGTETKFTEAETAAMLARHAKATLSAVKRLSRQIG